MSTEIWKSQLNDLGWKFSHQCGGCSGKKLYYKRGSAVMTVIPSRDFYEFTENGVRKTGKLSQLDSVIKAAQGK